MPGPTVYELAQTTKPCSVVAVDGIVESTIWFKTAPLDRTFCYRVAQLQLITNSCDQGFVDNQGAGSWSWFELSILADATSTEPRVKVGVPLVYRSHCNVLGSKTLLKNYGVVFDRRVDLLNEFEIGNVIAVRVCAQYQGWVNFAKDAKILVKTLDTDAFAPNTWSLSPPEEGSYSVSTQKQCHVSSVDHNLQSAAWFSTPPLDAKILRRIESIQLFTNARNQGWASNPEAGSWTWFDIVVFESEDSTTPKVKNGQSLEWISHYTDIGQSTAAYREGKKFDRTHEMLTLLEPGDVITVRVCAQFTGWEHYAHDGRLAVQVSTKDLSGLKCELQDDYGEARVQVGQLEDQLQKFLDRITPQDGPTVISVEADILKNTLRSDQTFEEVDHPLRLLSLDGGAVRGIASARILKEVEDTMERLTGDPTTKPCDYFDMIAGTSTGGLIAVMLGRLRMTVQECIDAFNEMAETIFTNPFKDTDFLLTGAKYKASVLERAIKDVVASQLDSEDAIMLDQDNKCKSFVVAIRSTSLTDINSVTLLRTYNNPKVENSFSDAKIWEACRATSAAPTYFPGCTINGVQYVDGGVGHGNPVLLLQTEAKLVFGPNRPIGCLLSIGTGRFPNVDISKYQSGLQATMILTAFVSVATNTEYANYQARMASEPGTYFRLNPGIKIVEADGTVNWGKLISFDDWAGMPELVRITEEYLEGDEEKKIVEECAQKLASVEKLSK
ncbi:hypothetical protein ABKN59_007113 [Abortiporus biennis]